MSKCIHTFIHLRVSYWLFHVNLYLVIKSTPLQSLLLLVSIESNICAHYYMNYTNYSIWTTYNILLIWPCATATPTATAVAAPASYYLLTHLSEITRIKCALSNTSISNLYAHSWYFALIPEKPQITTGCIAIVTRIHPYKHTHTRTSTQWDTHTPTSQLNIFSTSTDALTCISATFSHIASSNR